MAASHTVRVILIDPTVGDSPYGSTYCISLPSKGLFAECPTVMFAFRGMSMFTVYAHDEPLCVTLQWITRDTTFHVLTDETAI